tara:strand:- start:4578 stop:5450 length:873 start_codon:yes stop_codon:yes gene_type:complete
MDKTILNNENLNKYNWFNLGGPAKIFFKPKSLLDIKKFLENNNNRNKKIHILGAGSNTLFRDGGFDGIVIKLGKEFAYTKILSDGNIEVGAATPDKKIADFAIENSITGLEFLSCIPGTIGGAIIMNSGCYGQDISQSVISIEGLTLNGKLKSLNRDQINFFYRGSNFGENLIILSVKLKGNKDTKEKIEKKQNEFLNQKRKSQPTNVKTCGSTFKNPSNKKAWELIKMSGCSNLSIGGARLSEQHCNFFLNNGKAKSSDIEMLIEEVRNQVFLKTGVKLDLEIKIVGKK